MPSAPSAPPLVHVALPVRDVAPWIGQALASLSAQTLDRWTATVVDDGSVDDTAAVVAAWTRRDPRIRLLRTGPLGLVSALNLAVVGDAPFVARLDGDDVCLPERLAAQLAFLQARRDVDVVDCRVEHFADDGELPGGMDRYRRWQDRIETDADFERELLVENPVCHPAVMARRSALLSYRDGDFPEDYDLWLRVRRAGGRFHKLPRRLVRWRDRSGRLTRTDRRYRREAFFRLKWAHFEATGDPAARVAVWGAAAGGRPWIRALVRAGRPPVAVVDVDPRAIGRTRHGVEVVPPEALPAARPDLVLAAVGRAGARALIEGRLAELGLPALAVVGLSPRTSPTR